MWILTTTSEPQSLYCGPDTGWVGETPPAPPTPAEQAMKFATKQDADDYAKKYGMKADAVELP